VPNLALTDQVPHRSRDFLDGHVRVDTVLVVEVDEVGLQALERGLGDLPEVLGAAVEPLLGALRIEVELGGDHHPIANPSPDAASLEGFFAACCQASMLREEERPVAFRAVLAEPNNHVPRCLPEVSQGPTQPRTTPRNTRPLPKIITRRILSIRSIN
jgi:hypothetical protein